MRNTFIALVCLLSACASAPQEKQYDLQMAENDCIARNAPFELLSGCVESQLQQTRPEWVLQPDADLARVYLSWLSAAGNRVARGEMAEAVGRQQAHDLRERLLRIRAQRNAAAKQQALVTALSGYAIMESANQAGRTGPITCHTTPTGLGTTMTTCQ
jgi:hypothetical protein